jgi:hypothetical protein
LLYENLVAADIANSPSFFGALFRLYPRLDHQWGIFALQRKEPAVLVLPADIESLAREEES